MLAQYADDNGETTAYRSYDTAEEKSAALIELRAMAEGKEVRWVDESPVGKTAYDPFGQSGRIGFVVRKDQADLISTLRESLMETAKSAPCGSDYSKKIKEITQQVAPWNYDFLVEAIAGVGEVFRARFPAPIGRILVRGGGRLECADFDSATISASGVEVTSMGETTRYNVRGDEYDIELRLPRKS